MVKAFKALIIILIITLVGTISMTTISMASDYTVSSEIRLASGYGDYTMEDLPRPGGTEETIDSMIGRPSFSLDDILEDIREQLQDSAIDQSTGLIDPDAFSPENNRPTQSDIDPLMDKANLIIGTIKVIGIVVSFITLMVLGIKYMTGSVSEKAEYKKTMIPYLIGAFMLLAITQVVGIIAEAVADFNT